MNQLANFHKQQCDSVKVPCFDNRPLDIFNLKKAVEMRGGFDNVCNKKQWAQLGQDLSDNANIRPTISTLLKTAYQTLIYPYEQYLRSIKAGDKQEMIGSEHGGPFAQSPAPSATTRLASQPRNMPKRGKYTCAFVDPGSS
jgi:hypothetical protein